MLSKLHIPVSSGGDMKVALYTIHLHGAIDSTGRARSLHQGFLSPRRLLELRRFSRHAHHISDVLFVMAPIILPAQAMYTPSVPPLSPARLVLGQHLPREDQIAGCVLHVDVQVGAVHRHDDVQVDLHRVAHSLLHHVLVRFVPAMPPPEFGQGQ